MLKVWGQIVKRNKIVQEHMTTYDGPACLDSYMECLHTICDALDIERPVMLQKHELDMDRFATVRFLPDDFMETVDFDRFDVEIYIEKEK